jgi:HSP20 family protein
MSIKDIIPWKRTHAVPVRREDEPPFFQMQRQLNNLFDDFWGNWPDLLPARGEGASAFLPHVGVKETDAEYQVTAELPGLDEKDVKVELHGATLVLEGEKKEEHEEKKSGYVWSERRYGSFRRDIPLPEEVDREKIKAAFKKGVLTVTLPKTPAARKTRRKIDVKGD